MGEKERLKRIRSIRLILFKLESGEQKCLKTKHGVIRHGRQDRAKRKYSGRLRSGSYLGQGTGT